MIQDIFCKIIKGELKADVVWQDENFLVINDIHPQAPVHVLIIPKKHFEALHDFEEGDALLLGKAILVAEKVAKQLGVHDKGYRLIINEGVHGGKLVPHLHVHLLGGKPLGPKIVK
ncbi:MAG: histidine triad nucleotide-binding protein [Candidatus Yanofskybacteria bacterium RIFCSPLOWO2_02_FULL_43_10]|uniref:Histidine triad nucleotide-binding protein n=1 Tax=Candidatus Yanofskybacteria bacterium RIFCSPLOWO2_12_FULL_43_11b TaxID=1802710 RepID=A0A1F8H9U2_9BACT|nr:MAG: histidine triad nucleotide-binding protein [Candidatus Yanofskybacteria bacterium RIFCSPHIGHO2_01_FULL_43_32]OGN12128.1 MAG: histidine triad nucleotide-binding protein [Candidatus Yanofskybacteria bacterium RIFCSPHIGHO2_02_FULL_43_12]OGN18262.1 MAG: histidine triad nucleotide-binding protein [Candidatus Yanofskybacteria bacterium RIFCSPHIGHO2_12_FULL_43_11]OGN25223.1 MAG: histidine triad nucleotide-binding protein [Candidatus Yanofskybacteria bacterium RIFCSPLOWO2_01_FULL_43_46]OGN29261